MVILLMLRTPTGGVNDGQASFPAVLVGNVTDCEHCVVEEDLLRLERLRGMSVAPIPMPAQTTAASSGSTGPGGQWCGCRRVDPSSR
jgi:hypothetical protein